MFARVLIRISEHAIARLASSHVQPSYCTKQDPVIILSSDVEETFQGLARLSFLFESLWSGTRKGAVRSIEISLEQGLIPFPAL